jgi:hypothetical protein
VVGTLNQQTSEVSVAGLGDPELRVAFAGLAPFWSQAKAAAHIAASTKALLGAQSQDERQSGDVTDAMDGQQGLSLGVFGLSHALDLPVVLLDLQRQRCDLFEHWVECQLESGRHGSLAALSKALRG